MKKFLFFVISLFTLCFFVACSNEDECGYYEKISCSLNNENYDLLKKKVDSISNYYLQNHALPQTRKGIVQYYAGKKVQSLADDAGRVVGGCIGKNVGALIGGIGSPVGSILGCFIGNKAGRFIGSMTASYAAYLIVAEIFNRCNSSTYSTSNSAVLYYLPDSCSGFNDSIGYYHNFVMHELVRSGDKYVLENGKINYNLIYDDCLKYLVRYGAFEGCKDELLVAYRPDFKHDVVSYVQTTSDLSRNYSEGRISESTYQSRLIGSMDNYNLTDEERLAFSDYAVELAETCLQLSYEANVMYADDLNHMISNSGVSEELKSELRSTTNMVVNSSIFCQMVE